MDGPGDPNQPPHLFPPDQPGYPPPMAQQQGGGGEGMPPYQHHAPPPGYAVRPIQVPPPGGGAMGALTAAAVAAKPATPKGGVPNSGPRPSKGQGPLQSPPGKVVESGQEHTGRWTKEEHEAFLAALQLYGKEWKKVAARVKTRTVVQTRTHAQKYFQKLQKVLETGGEQEATSVLGMPGITLGGSPGMTHTNIAAMMDLGVPNSTDKKSKRRRSSSAKKKEQQQQQQQYKPPQGQSPAIPRSSSATAAALLNMSNDRRLSSSSIGPPGTSPTAAYPPAPAPSQQQHGFTTTMAEPSSASAHGFGYPPPTAAAGGAAGISIVAPAHEDAFLAGKFPEPSPAACGKRKLAEIAAAQMLAGVVGATAAPADAQPPSTLKKRGSVSGTAELAAASVAVDQIAATYPEPFSGTPPPPPPPEGAAEHQPEPERRMSLQIVNPDTFVGLDNGFANRRLIHGQPSPSTPWDGQLEALVSQVKNQEMPPSSPPQAPSTANGSAAPDDTLMPDQGQAMLSPHADLLPLPLRNPGNDLQRAICNKLQIEVASLCSELAATNPSSLNERDENGFQPLHSAAALGLWDYGVGNDGDPVAICNMLIDSGADVVGRDAQGNTPVHWAARSGHCEVLGLLLQKGCPLDAQNDAGETALHWAMRAGERGTGQSGAGTVKVLVENGAQVNVFNRDFKRPLDVAAEGFEGLEDSAKANAPAGGQVVDQRARRAARWNLMRFSSQCRTLVLHHRECLDHLAKSDHDWEVPDRIDHIMSILNSRTAESCDPGDEQSFRPYEMTVSSEFERATLELLSRIHSAEYLAFVNDLSKELERKRKQQLIEDAQANLLEEGPERPSHVVPFTPMVQRKILKDAKTKDDGHSDTAFSAGSLVAARRAAGAVQHAVDCVLVGRNRNAFCIVRPPGHHAGINGLLSDAESCGFCLFNNVAAGAMHALSDEKHRPRCERCAIVDIDAHHGNGTEEIVRKCHDSGRLLFFSVHLYDYDKPKKGQTFQYKFYPGTGAEDDVAHNVINVPIAPLWREKEVVKSISLASNGGAAVEPRQTRQRSKQEAAKRVPSLPDLSKLQNEAAISAASLRPFGAVSGDSASVASDSSQSSKRPPLPSASPHYPPHYLMGVGRLAYRRAIMHRLLPALRAFNPDLIILSTGFDAARGDVGNARHYVNGTEAMGFDLEPEDYAWTARKVCEVADICCNGRVVSVLEGGYGRTPPPVPAPPLFDGEAPERTEPVKQKLDRSFFSECALQHLKGLVDPYHPDED